MKTEVKSLIAALTSERNSLNKAIAVLQELDGGATPRQAVKTVQRENKSRSFHRWTTDERRQVVAEMEQATGIGHSALSTARKIARRLGCSHETISVHWRRWQREFAGVNGSAPVTTTDAPIADFTYTAQ